MHQNKPVARDARATKGIAPCPTHKTNKRTDQPTTIIKSKPDRVIVRIPVDPYVNYIEILGHKKYLFVI